MKENLCEIVFICCRTLYTETFEKCSRLPQLLYTVLESYEIHVLLAQVHALLYRMMGIQILLI